MQSLQDNTKWRTTWGKRNNILVKIANLEKDINTRKRRTKINLSGEWLQQDEIRDWISGVTSGWFGMVGRKPYRQRLSSENNKCMEKTSRRMACLIFCSFHTYTGSSFSSKMTKILEKSKRNKQTLHHKIYYDTGGILQKGIVLTHIPKTQSRSYKCRFSHWIACSQHQWPAYNCEKQKPSGGHLWSTSGASHCHVFPNPEMKVETRRDIPKSAT